MNASGRLIRTPDFVSAFVEARTVDVWLPPDYGRDDSRRFPVLYMHDGRNLFTPETSTLGVDWGVAEAIVREAQAGAIRPAIVVGLWHGSQRYREYMPQQALAMAEAGLQANFAQEHGGAPVSDDYLRCLVEEVKPWIDATYRTRPGRESTFVMGSSMGGLISLYALCRYPAVFGGAGCLSTHWPAGEGIVIAYLRQALPPPGSHKIYFDHGTETLDALYEPYQTEADAVMQAAGYRAGVDWLTRKFEGAEHSERAWRARVHIPLRFLLGRDGEE